MPNNKDRRAIRYTLAKRQGWRCFWCDKPMTKQSVTFDHKKPACMGGGYTLRNGVAACRGCNEDRGNTPFGVYKRQCEERRARDAKLGVAAADRATRAAVDTRTGSCAYVHPA